jgi:hypothetical protein
MRDRIEDASFGTATPASAFRDQPSACCGALNTSCYLEIAMPALTAFRRPVTLYVGLGFPRQIDDAEEAFMLLNEMPFAVRGPAHAAALKACRAAMHGEVNAETARGVVEAFARSKGILADEAIASMAMEAKRDLLGV